MLREHGINIKFSLSYQKELYVYKLKGKEYEKNQ